MQNPSYRLLEEASRRWGYGAPHIPRRLLEAVVELGGNDVEVCIARYKGGAIAGGVIPYGSSEAFFWTAALRANYGHQRPSNLLNAEMIRVATERGMQWYDQLRSPIQCTQRSQARARAPSVAQIPEVPA